MVAGAYLPLVHAAPSPALWAPWADEGAGPSPPTTLQAAQRRLAFAVGLLPPGLKGLVDDVLGMVCERVVGAEDGALGLLRSVGLEAKAADVVDFFARELSAADSLKLYEQGLSPFVDLRSFAALDGRTQVEVLGTLSWTGGGYAQIFGGAPISRFMARLELGGGEQQKQLQATLARVPTVGALRKAVEKADLREVRRLLRVGVDPNTVREGELSCTLLHLAVAQSGLTAVALDILTALVEGGADVELCDEQRGLTPLMFAAATTMGPAVQRLLELGADHTAISPRDKSPYEYALCEPHSYACRSLREWAAAHPNPAHDARIAELERERSKAEQETALREAAGAGRAGEVRRILAQGTADVDSAGVDGDTALHHAAGMGHEQTAAWLAECGATVDKATRTGSTPLMWAASSGHAAVVRQLLALGADRSLVATDGPFRGQTALDVAEARGKAEAVALLRA